MTRSPLLKLPRYTDRELWRTLQLGKDERHPFTLGKNIASKKGNADNPFDYFQLNMTPQTIIVALITTATTPNPGEPPIEDQATCTVAYVGLFFFGGSTSVSAYRDLDPSIYKTMEMSLGDQMMAIPNMDRAQHIFHEDVYFSRGARQPCDSGLHLQHASRGRAASTSATSCWNSVGSGKAAVGPCNFRPQCRS